MKKRCAECGASGTPQWRQGPSGPQTLCNACGVRYSRLMRRQRCSRKRPQADFNAEVDHQDASDTATDSNSKDGVTIALHPLRGSSEEPLQSNEVAVVPWDFPSEPELQKLLQHTLVAAPLFVPHAMEPCFGMPSLFAGAGTQAEAALAACGADLEDNLVCEAALNLLSMASGEQQQQKKQKQHLVAGSFEAGLAQLKQQVQDVGLDIGRDVLQQVLPLMSPTQLQHLQDLCQQFDSMHTKLMAAQAARDAVAKILSIKKAEARHAGSAARLAARILHQEARKISQTSGDATTGSPRQAMDPHSTSGCSPRKCHSPKRARFQ